MRSPTASLHDGEIIAGRYVVERMLGVGGTGVVLAARDQQRGEIVALKLVLPGETPSPEAVARLKREAREAMRLRNEHVARVLDVGEIDGGHPFLVIEYLEGHDLQAYAHAAGGKLPIAEAADAVLQACEAIAEAHANGILHKDLKPTNLFVTTREDGRHLVKVLDLGISKLVAGATALVPTRPMDGSPVIGSPLYAAPEAIDAPEEADARSDLWSLGVILYELLAGAVPFPADSLAHLASSIIESPPIPLRSLRPDVPSALEQIVLGCLEKDRDKRFQSAGELARVLETFAGPDAAGAAARIARMKPAASVVHSSAPAPSRRMEPAPPRGAVEATAPVPSRRMTVLAVVAAILALAVAAWIVLSPR
jgi:serine/threonine-protein kinase